MITVHSRCRNQLEAFKIAEVANINQRRMLLTILIATIFGGLVAFWVQLHLYYQFGADSGYFGPWALGYGREYFGRLTNWITYPLDTDWLGVIFIGIGFSVMMVLTYLRVKFFWLPLHPLGYVMASNQEMSDLWIPLLIALTPQMAHPPTRRHPELSARHSVLLRISPRGLSDGQHVEPSQHSPKHHNVPVLSVVVISVA